ncbi:MAG: transposase [Treponema sp.]|nr:transposase [Treponema sp.]
MELTEKQYWQIQALLPKQRGNVKIENRILLNALIYRRQNGCSWRALPPSFGDRHAIYVRLWARNEVLERVYAVLTRQRIGEHKGLRTRFNGSQSTSGCAGSRKKRRLVAR